MERPERIDILKAKMINGRISRRLHGELGDLDYLDRLTSLTMKIRTDSLFTAEEMRKRIGKKPGMSIWRKTGSKDFETRQRARNVVAKYQHAFWRYKYQ